MLSPARFLQGIGLSFGLRNARVAALTWACSQVMSGCKTWCLSATALTSEALKRLLRCTLYSYNATIYPGVQMASVSSQENITDYCGITCNGLGFYPRGKEIPQVASIWVRLGLGPIESAMIRYDKTNTWSYIHWRHTCWNWILGYQDVDNMCPTYPLSSCMSSLMAVRTTTTTKEIKGKLESRLLNEGKSFTSGLQENTNLSLIVGNKRVLL